VYEEREFVGWLGRVFRFARIKLKKKTFPSIAF